MASFADFQELFDEPARKLDRLGVIPADGKRQSPGGNPHAFKAFDKPKVFVAWSKEAGEGFLAVGRNVELPWLIDRIFPPKPVICTKQESKLPGLRI